MSASPAAPARVGGAGPRSPLTHDAFLGRRFTLVQPKKGFRCGSDALFLAAAAPLSARVVVDLGCGPGAVGFACAAMCPDAAVTLVDREAEALALCRESLSLAENAGIAHRLSCVLGDVADPPAAWSPRVTPEAADVVLANPPYFDADASRGSPLPERDRARRDDGAGLDAWARAAHRLLRPDGVFALIVPAARLADLLAAAAGRFGGLLVYPLRPRAEADATRLICAGRKGSRAPLRLAPGLVTHDGDRYTEAAEAVLRGGERLPHFAS